MKQKILSVCAVVGALLSFVVRELVGAFHALNDMNAMMGGPLGSASRLFHDRILRVENAGSGKTALIYPAIGPTYDKFVLSFGAGSGLTAADLSEIRIKGNDVEFFKDKGSLLDLRQAYNGIDTDAAEVTIDFTEPNARGSAAEQYLSSLPSNYIKKLVIEVDIAAAEGVGEDFSAITCLAEYRGPTRNPFILKRRPLTFYAPAAGEHEVFLPSGISGGIIKRVWAHAANVSAAQLRVGQFIAQNFTAIGQLTRLQERNGRVPQANVRVLDFVVDGNLNGALNTATRDMQGQNVVLKLTTTAAVQIDFYIDYIDPIQRLK
jgi:hypothetical protein